MRAAIPMGALLAAVAAVAFWLGVQRERSTSPAPAVDVTRWSDCTGATTANADIARALEAAAGKTLVVPAGCRLTLGPPAPDTAAAVVIPTATRIRCDGPAARFVLARRLCTGATTTPDATCADASDCAGTAPRCSFAGGGERGFDGGSDTPTVFAAADGSHDVEIEGCTIQVGQIDGYWRCVDGSSPGRACSREAPCDGGRCAPASAVPAPHDAVNVIDFSRASPSRISQVTVLGHHAGTFTFKAGPLASITDDDNTRTVGSPQSTADDANEVRFGAIAAGLSTLARNRLRAAFHTIEVGGIYPSQVADNWVEIATGPLDGTAPAVGIQAGTAYGQTAGNSVWCRTPSAATGIFLTGQIQQLVHHNGIVGCFRGIEVDQRIGNMTIDHNRIAFGSGAKLVLSRYGNTVAGNYLAWGTGDDDGPPGGGTCRRAVRRPCRSDADCLAGDACRREPIIWLGQDGELAAPGSEHNLIEAGNLLFSEHENVTAIRIANTGARCGGGAKAGQRCASDADCSGSQCARGLHHNITIRGNTFLNNSPGAIGVDLAELDRRQTTIDELMVSDNLFGGDGTNSYPTAIRMPTDPDAAHGVTITGNHGVIRTLVERWDWRSGTRSGNEPSADEGSTATLSLTNTGPALDAGDPVELDPAVRGAVRRGTNAAAVVGILLRRCEGGGSCLLATAGAGTCRVANATTVAVGDRLAPARDGLVRASSAATQVAVALAGRRTGEPAVIPCLVRAR